jgi:hypothetical protein
VDKSAGVARMEGINGDYHSIAPPFPAGDDGRAPAARAPQQKRRHPS